MVQRAPDPHEGSSGLRRVGRQRVQHVVGFGAYTRVSGFTSGSRRDVDLSVDSFWPDASSPTLSCRLTGLWYVGVTIGPQARRAGVANHVGVPEDYSDLCSLGWRPNGVVRTAPQIEAILMAFQGPPPAACARRVGAPRARPVDP